MRVDQHENSEFMTNAIAMLTRCRQRQAAMMNDNTTDIEVALLLNTQNLWGRPEEDLPFMPVLADESDQ